VSGKPSLPRVLRFAVASDLHVYEGEVDNSPSALRVGADETDHLRHPIAALLHLVKSQNLRADALLCPGDLGDRASTTGIQYAWAKLVQVQKAMRAKDLFATVGNHDIDSRGKANKFDPRGFLQTLDPPFPYKALAVADHFWSRHFAIVERGNFRIVLLNSSAFHGYENEYIHGRVSEHTLSALAKTLASTKKKQLVNILLCHHHPMLHSDRKLGDHDTMKHGQELLDLINHHGEWIVIHGHKHDPRLSYAAGRSSVTPIVFAAGSLTASLYPEIASTARNQFYIIEFPLDDIATRGLVGTFRAWDWIYESGWQPATSGSGLPSVGSFGHRENPNVIAQRVASCFAEDTIGWDELNRREGSLKYLIPNDRDQVLKAMKERFNLTILESDGEPIRVER
jgi:Icc-related predicted phosphoesterase